MSIYEITVEDTQNKKVLLEAYKGKTLLIVNTATNCIFTPQYKILESLYETYKDKGFVILDFPCNQFRNQTPGTIEEINQFCAARYETTFPRFNKIFVNGPDESILYTYLKAKKHGLFSSKIKWNFTKFLVDKNGNVIKRYAPNSNPKTIAKDIERIL
jgi:glutathione peroxidase